MTQALARRTSVGGMITRIGRLAVGLVDALEEQPDRLGDHLTDRVVQRGERRAGALGDAEVVVADDRDVLGDPDAAAGDAPTHRALGAIRSDAAKMPSMSGGRVQERGAQASAPLSSVKSP